MQILVVYASRYGQTRRIAERIGDVARDAGARAHVLEIGSVPRDLPPHLSDVVVLAGGVYFGRFSRALAAFARSQRVDLAKVRTWFVAVSGAARTAAGRPTAEADARRFVGESGWIPDGIQLFAGGEPFTKYGLFTRWLMVWFAWKFGRTVDTRIDYDFTDWDEVDRFARSLVGVEVHDPALALM